MTNNKFHISPRHEVSIRKALVIGYLFLGIIPVCIIFGGMWYSIKLEEVSMISNLQTGLGFVISFVFGWLWWSVFVTKWKIWAYSRVRKVRELKKRAIKDRLIWPDRSWFNKLEITTINQKRLLIKLNKRFEWERKR